MPEQSTLRARLRLGPRNYAALAAGAVCLVVGYWLLARGSTIAAPILLVVGYCVLIPLGLVL